MGAEAVLSQGLSSPAWHMQTFSLLKDMLIHLSVAWVQPKEPARVALVPLHGAAQCLHPWAGACCDALCSPLLAGSYQGSQKPGQGLGALKVCV